MTRGKLILLLFAALVAVLFVLRLSFSLPEENPPPGSSEAPAKVTSISKKWTDTDLEELQEWAESQEQSRASGTTLEFDAVVEEGEMMVTDIIETAPGVFHFTQIAPQPGPDDGTILIKAQRLSVDLEGNTGILSAPSIILKSGSVASVTIASEDSFYEIEIQAETEGNGTRLTGQVVEDGGGI